jgi:hypothetical protein
MKERANEEWRTPIEFYGKVVDENERPISGATVVFGINDLSSEGYSELKKESDVEGLFSLAGAEGKHTSVRVFMNGYYASASNRTSFTYAGDNQNFVPIAHQPVVFHLRKAGPAEPLITMKRSFRIPRDGTPVEIDLIQGKSVPGGSGHLRVACWTEDKGKKSGEKYDWRCHISIPGGGLQISTNEFAFRAPDDGYQQVSEINMPATAAQWSSDVEVSFFVKLPGSKFGRMTFAMIAGGDHFCLIESALNPSGSRNVEFNPAVQPKEPVFE